MAQNGITFGYIVYAGDVVDIIDIEDGMSIFLIPIWSLV